MYPSINILHKEISTYTIMALIGIFAVGIYVKYVTTKKQEDDYNYLVTLLIASIGLVIGSHLLYAITNINLILITIKHIDKITSFKLLLQILYLIFGGSVFYGGLLGGLLAGAIYIKSKKLDFKEITDTLTPCIPLFHGFARIGCFLVGCCYGIESKLGFTYQYAIVETANHVSRFPVQLVEAVLNFILFIILYNFYKKNKYKGKLIYIYLISYAVIRFILEFFRGDSYRGFIGFLSTSQILSLLILITIFIIYIINAVRRKYERI